jgi:hypothetical protein
VIASLATFATAGRISSARMRAAGVISPDPLARKYNAISISLDRVCNLTGAPTVTVGRQRLSDNMCCCAREDLWLIVAQRGATMRQASKRYRTVRRRQSGTDTRRLPLGRREHPHRAAAVRRVSGSDSTNSLSPRALAIPVSPYTKLRPKRYHGAASSARNDTTALPAEKPATIRTGYLVMQGRASASRGGLVAVRGSTFFAPDRSSIEAYRQALLGSRVPLTVVQ